MELERVLVNQLPPFGSVEEHLRNADVCSLAVLSQRFGIQPSSELHGVIVRDIAQVLVPEELIENLLPLFPFLQSVRGGGPAVKCPGVFHVVRHELRQGARSPPVDQSRIAQLVVDVLPDFRQPTGRLSVQAQTRLPPRHQFFNVTSNLFRVRLVHPSEADCLAVAFVVDETNSIALRIFFHARHCAQCLS
ncbi:MAG: hypothetical protein WKF77_15915 [Planctomycetaceae bacterium]